MKPLTIGLVLAAFAAILPAQHCGLQIGSALGSSGQPCDPFSCTATNVDAYAGSSVLLRTKGAREQLHFLLVSGQSAPCVAIPGIANSLMVAPPGAAATVQFNWARLYITGPGPQCGGWIGSMLLPLPAALPIGLQLRAQLLAPVPTASGATWTFSNAVDLTIV